MKKQVEQWMHINYGGSIDGQTGEINRTNLAEAAAYQFDLGDDEIEEWIFELADKVARYWEDLAAELGPWSEEEAEG